ncbi:MAG: TetR/AcrR family transcriptional regulator, partial [Bacteriodetes bacterium]|nr:TetR/AcrR family transcriptional regulator [Bacteroidota bacterium]
MPNKHDKNLTTEKRIMEAAIAEFIDKGFAGARMQSIADRAEINKAMLHYYFRSKELLFQTIFRDIAAEFYKTAAGALNTNKPYLEKVRDLVENEIDLFSQRPNIPLFILSEVNRNTEHFKTVAANSPIKTMFDTFFAETKRAIKKKEIIATDPLQLILNILALVRFPFVAKPMCMLHNYNLKTNYDITTSTNQRSTMQAQYNARSSSPTTQTI